MAADPGRAPPREGEGPEVDLLSGKGFSSSVEAVLPGWFWPLKEGVWDWKAEEPRAKLSCILPKLLLPARPGWLPLCAALPRP